MLSTLTNTMSSSQANAKRKGDFSDNPLAKKAKKDAGNKRKLLNGEEQPGGLIIVRAQSQSGHSNSQPAPSTSQPPTKKLRADSQQPTNKAKPKAAKPSSSKPTRPTTPPPSTNRSRDILSSPGDPVAMASDVRAMEDENSHLRKSLRAPQSKGKGKGKSVDRTEPLAALETDSPMIERNKAMRGGAMAAINQYQGNDDGNSRTPNRRSSIGGRGKRVSASFESTGISQPHPSVHERSFFKHIDVDLPDAERMRVLLVWCSLRAAGNEEGLDPGAARGMKAAKEEIVRSLAARQVDVGTSSSGASGSGNGTPAVSLRENEQNTSNRRFEVTYTEQIQKAQEEDESWKKARSFYDAFISSKSKGKQKEETGSNHPSFALAQHILNGTDRPEIQTLLQDVEFKVDMLNSYQNAARATASVAERALDERFAHLSTGLAQRSNSNPPGLLGTPTREPPPQDLFRALWTVDRERPPAMVGDAARRAVREVQRVEERGGGVSERRLTGVPPPTPRTPKRGSTPGRT
ncbi:Mis12-Mtw1 protein family-domain-containing protein [Armillaria luteobubalina]|uniref:Mis12-Mtw1 protein family-domain-containing protein n=1 Tax=Armillaria luteobubalina TaxID=153913 RepID=A0AA39UW45_9AGAR|nr:Mis12-Mtw1 protein family-domain-containing protein [Armillaria luteobubalina]